MAIHTELEKLYYEDMHERETLDDSDPLAVQSLQEHDVQRLERLKEIITSIDTHEIWNCHYIAYLFQHGDTTEDFRLAHEYAKKAIDMGSNVTKWLYAATLDRWLVSKGKPQKFGTQFKQINGTWELFPVDPVTTDEEREKYGVPALHQALEVFLNKSL